MTATVLTILAITTAINSVMIARQSAHLRYLAEQEPALPAAMDECPHVWGKWEMIDRGNVTYKWSKIGVYVQLSRTCEICGDTQLTEKTT